MRATITAFLLSVLFIAGCNYNAFPSAAGVRPPQDANTIIIRDTLSQSAYYKRVTDILFQNGIGISNADKELGQVTTSPGSFKNGNIILTIFISDGSVFIRGQWSWNMTISLNHVSSTPGDYQEIEYGGMNDSPKLNAWNAMNKIALQIPGTIEYLRK